MAKSFVQELGERLASVESRLSSLSSGNRLDHASLDGTTLYLKGDGQLGRIGRQPDGSNGVHVVKVQPPPQLTAPILTVGEQAGTCLVEWDGETFDGRRMPLIHGHTEIWAELVGEDWSPTVAPGGSAKRVGTIRDRTGGEVVVALPQAGIWAVWLRAMGADRETAGPWSPVSTVEIKPLVDTEAIEAELEDARDRITEADERLTAGQEALTGHLDNLNDVRLPALEQDISNAVSEANDNIQDFENRWDTQWDTTIPALADRQDTLEGEIADGLTQVHNQAEAMAEAARDDAVNMAAANAQSEYDRLQEIAEKALSRAGDNVLEDPSFETDYWLNNLFLGTFAVAHSSLSRTGDYGMAITRDTTATSATNMTFDTIDVEPDDTWRFSIWYRTDGTTDLNQGAGTRLRIRDGSNNILESSTTFEVGTEHSRAVVTYTVPEGVSSLRPTLVVSHTTGALIVDDVSFQEVGAAAEALRMAEVARQQAEAAHIAAGNAVDTAANAYDAASSKSTVHWSLSAPSGTADSTDDVWWQYELRNGRRVVIGQWFWDNGVWRETEIAEEWLPQVNIGTGTYGDLRGDRLTANTVHANKMLVGPRNIITDLDFSQVNAGSIEDGWGSYTGGWQRVAVSWSDQQSHFAAIISGHESDSDMKALHYGGSGPTSASLPCEPGERFRVRFQVIRYVGWSNDDDYRAEFRWVDSNGNGIGWSRFQFGSGYGNQAWVEFEALAPAGATRFYFRFSKNGAAAGRRGVGNLSIQSMTGSDLIVQGAVKAEHVDSVELTASSAFLDNAMVNLIQGRMANFDEALIGGTLLKDNSIATRHLVVADATNFAPEPGEYEAAWSFVNARVVANASAFEGAAIALDNTATDNSQARGPLLAVHPGDTIYVGAQIGWSGSAPTGGSVYLRMEWFEDADSSRETFTDAASTSNVSLWLEGTVTVPDYATHARFYIYAPATSGNPGTRRIRSTKVRVQTGGELIVDGSINSAKVNTQEFFAAQAVIDEVWTNIVRSRLIESQGIITEDMIATGAITTPKLTVTEELVGEIAKLIRIEAGSLASNDIESMRIVSSLIEATTYLIHDADGDVSVRLDGVANYIAGRLRAGMAEGSSISLDYGEKVRFSGLNEEGEPDPIRVISTPYLNFHTTNVTYQENQEPSIHLERGNPSGRDGMMIINPGYPEGTPPFRGLLNVVGDVVANQVRSREWSYSQYGFSVPSDNPNLTTALSRESSGGTYLAGRHHGASQTRARDSFWVSDQYELAAGARRRRFFTWGAPPPTGERSPILSVRLTEAASDRNAYVVVNSSHHTNTGYAVNEYNPSSARATYYVYQLAVWEDA